MTSSLIPVQKNSKILAIFAIICTGVVGLVYEFTKDKIAEQQQQQLLSTLHSIVAPASHDNVMANDCVLVSSPLLGGDAFPQTAYIARMSTEGNNSNAIAIALTTTALDGYSGAISLIVAMDMSNVITGVRILNHQETPGLGDKIEEKKSDWILAFAGKSLIDENDKRWAVVKDKGMFDQFTGATITPRAVVKAIKKASIYLQKNKDFIVNQPNACGKSVVAPGEIEDNAITEINTDESSAKKTSTDDDGSTEKNDSKILPEANEVSTHAK